MTTRAPAPYASLTLVACERPRASDALEQLHQEWESLQSPSPGSQDAAAQQAAEGACLLRMVGSETAALLTWFSDPALLEAAPHTTVGAVTLRTGMRPARSSGPSLAGLLEPPGDGAHRPLIGIIEAWINPLVPLSVDAARSETIDRIGQRVADRLASMPACPPCTVMRSSDSSALMVFVRAATFEELARVGHAVRVSRWQDGDGASLDPLTLEQLCGARGPSGLPWAAEHRAAIHLFRATRTLVGTPAVRTAGPGSGAPMWRLAELDAAEAHTLAPEADVAIEIGYAPWNRPVHAEIDGAAQKAYAFGAVQARIPQAAEGADRRLSGAGLHAALSARAGTTGLHSAIAISIPPPATGIEAGPPDPLTLQFVARLTQAREAVLSRDTPWLGRVWALRLPLAQERRLNELLDRASARLLEDAELFTVMLPAIEDLLRATGSPARAIRKVLASLGEFLELHPTVDTRPRAWTGATPMRRLHLGRRHVTEALLGVTTELLAPCGLARAMPIIVDGMTPLTKAFALGRDSVVIRLPGPPARLEPLDWSIAAQLVWCGMRTRPFQGFDDADPLAAGARITAAWRHLAAVVDAGPPEPNDTIRGVLRRTALRIQQLDAGRWTPDLVWLLGRLPAMCGGVRALEHASGRRLGAAERWLHMGPLAVRHLLARASETTCSSVDEACLALLLVSMSDDVDEGADGPPGRTSDRLFRWPELLDALCTAVLAAREWLQESDGPLSYPMRADAHPAHRRLTALCEDVGIGASALLRAARLLQQDRPRFERSELRRVIDAWLRLSTVLAWGWPTHFSGELPQGEGHATTALIDYVRAASGRGPRRSPAETRPEPPGPPDGVPPGMDPWVPFMTVPPVGPEPATDAPPADEGGLDPDFWPPHVHTRLPGSDGANSSIVLERRGGRVLEDLGHGGDAALHAFLSDAARVPGPPLSGHLARYLRIVEPDDRPA